MPPKKAPQVSYIQSLDRGLQILQTVAGSRKPVSLGELADLLDIDRSSAFRLAQTLRRRGFLSTPPDRKDYILGSAMWTLTRRYDWSNMLIQVAHNDLKSLAAGINETAHLAIREGKQALFIDSAHATHVIVVAGQIGELVPLYCTAHGKALLADMTERELKAIFGAGPYESYAPNTITGLPALAAECVAIRERGYAIDEAEFSPQMRCLAAPIRLADGAIVGSIGISAPETRFLREHIPATALQVVRIAENIGSLLSIASEEAAVADPEADEE